MSFDRLRIQQECEKLTGCVNLADWARYKTTFEMLTLSPQQALMLAPFLVQDGKDLYYKGLLSLCESIQSMNRHLFSWATVKAYYSIFYLLRSSLAQKGYAIVRNKCLYLLSIQPGGKPVRKSSDKYKNDHLCVINLYRDMYSSSDILQSNNIDDVNPYVWIMDRRNQVNYRQREFHDPDPPSFLQLVAENIDLNRLDNLITSYVDDMSFLYCFQPEHACLALPIRRLILTKDEYANSGVTLSLTPDKSKLISTLLTLGNGPIQRLNFFI